MTHGPLGVLLSLSGLVIFAQAAAAADPAMLAVSDLAGVAQLGPVGLVLFLLAMVIRGDLRTKHELEAERRRAERAESQVDDLIEAQTRTLEVTNQVLRDRGGARAGG